MKVYLPLIGLLAVSALAGAHPHPASSDLPAAASASATTPSPIAAHRVDFATQVQPILESHCQPCHFKGGKMYERLPFDKGETIVVLGEKMFTRIKDEGEQKVIREFLAQEALPSSR